MDGRDTRGKFVKGHSGFKPLGAQSELRQNIRTFLASEWPNFQTWFSGLKDREKVETYLALMPFVIGKLTAIASTDSFGNDIQRHDQIDFSKLSASALDEVLNAINQNYHDTNL
jgi:hypothetical protein